MHMVIRVVVESHDGVSGAVQNAKRYFESYLSRYAENPGPFDYCTPMVEGHTVSGSDRWIDYEDKEAAFPLTSDPGRAEVNDAWDATKKQMARDLEPIFKQAQMVLAQQGDVSDFRDKIIDDTDMVQHKTDNALGYQSLDHFLYVDGWSGSGISDARGWQHVQELIENEQERDENRMWVVPLDVHH